MNSACAARQFPSLLSGRKSTPRWLRPQAPSRLQSLDDLFLSFLRKPCAFRAIHLLSRPHTTAKPSSVLAARSLYPTNGNSEHLTSTQPIHIQIRWKSKRASKKPDLSVAKIAGPVAVAPKKKSPVIAELGGISEDQYQKSRHRFKPLNSTELDKVFGGTMNQELGNYLLDTLQKQRMTGTLDVGVHGPGISEYFIETALSWLREKYPLDEDEATFHRFRREDRLEAARWMTVGHETGNWVPQAGADPNNPAGKSRLEKLREKNIAAREERERVEQAKAEERAMLLKDQGISVPAVINPETVGALERDIETEKRKAETAAWTKKYRERAMISKDLEPPKMTKAQRIVPSVLWAACAIAVCWMFAEAYEEPGRNGRLFPNLPMSAATVGTIVLINLGAFMFWRYPPAYRFMNMYFLVTPGLPRVSAQLGSFFSHQKPRHILGNMFFLWFLGTQVHEMVGRGDFVALYLTSGIFAATAATTFYVMTNRLTISILGASNAVCGMVSACCLLKGVVSMPGDFIPEKWNHFDLKWLLLGLVIVEAMAAKRPIHEVDHFGHLMGYAAGAVGALYIKYKKNVAAQRRVSASPSLASEAKTIPST